MRKKARLAYMLLFLSCLLAGSVVNAVDEEIKTKQTGTGKTYTLAQLQEDLEQFRSIINEKHPKLYTDKKVWEKLYLKQYKSLRDGMGQLDFYRILAPLVAALNCGHTNLNLPQLSQNFLSKEGKYLPLAVRVISGRVYVYHNLGNEAIPAGAEITAINGRTVPKIMADILSNLSADGSNISLKYCKVNGQFSNLYTTFIDSPEKYTLTCQGTDGHKAYRVVLSSVHKKQMDELMAKFTPSPANNGELYGQHFEQDYAVLWIRNFSFYDQGSQGQIKAFLDVFFQTLAERNTTHLILDLRGNGGGDPYCSSYLFRYLISSPYPYFAADSSFYDDLKQPLAPLKNSFTGRLYTLINGMCFSSTGHFCSLLKFYKIGLFIGEETGGSFVCTANTKDIMLRNTRITMQYSTSAFKTAVSGLTPGRGIMPDYTVTRTMEDYWTGKDVEMDLAMELLKKDKSMK